jgi:phosphomannomutase
MTRTFFSSRYSLSHRLIASFLSLLLASGSINAVPHSKSRALPSDGFTNTFCLAPKSLPALPTPAAKINIPQIKINITNDMKKMALFQGLRHFSDDPDMKQIHQTIMQRLDQLQEMMEQGEINPNAPIVTKISEKDDVSDHPDPNTYTVGFFATAADPFHYGHLVTALDAMVKFKMDKMVWHVHGIDERKVSLNPYKMRYPMAESTLKIFGDLFEFTDVNRSEDKNVNTGRVESNIYNNGETNLFNFLKWNHHLNLHAVYLAGSDHGRWKDKNGKPDVCQNLYEFMNNPNLAFNKGSGKHTLELGLIGRDPGEWENRLMQQDEEGEELRDWLGYAIENGQPVYHEEKNKTGLTINLFVPNFAYSSTNIRNAFMGEGPRINLKWIPFRVLELVRENYDAYPRFAREHKAEEFEGYKGFETLYQIPEERYREWLVRIEEILEVEASGKLLEPAMALEMLFENGELSPAESRRICSNLLRYIRGESMSDAESDEIRDYLQSRDPDLYARIENVRSSLTEEAARFDQLSDEEKLAFASRALSDLDRALSAREPLDIESALSSLSKLSQTINAMDPKKMDPSLKKRWTDLVLRRSETARLLSGDLMADFEKYKVLLDNLVTDSYAGIRSYLDAKVEAGVFKQAKADSLEAATRNYLEEWLDPENGIPDYIRQGIYRGLLEGRYGDVIYAFGFGWRQFGTAGIRNQAVMSEFEAILKEKELLEFAENVHAPILTGPNMINAVTLLQQVAALSNLYEEYRPKILEGLRGDPTRLETTSRELGIQPEFARNVLDGTITIAYDSRLNGKYYGQLLAAAFMEKGIRVQLFDAPSGVPGGAAAAKGPEFFQELYDSWNEELETLDPAEDSSRIQEIEQLKETFESYKDNVKGSIFGILISASHSEAWYNGFKAFLGFQKSQVDAKTKTMIMDARANIGYTDIQTDLDRFANPEKPFETIDRIFARKSSDDPRTNLLVWLGQTVRRGVEYFKGIFVDFYTLYFEHLKRRTLFDYRRLEETNPELLQRIREAKKNLNILYTSVFGVGASGAANLPYFFRKVLGYRNLLTVKKQTDEMNGLFPGHDMPDPGVVEGWKSNLFNFFQQYAGDDLQNFGELEKAVRILNDTDLAAATDPDIDRAGFMFRLDEGKRGNVKDPLIAWIRTTLREEYGLSPEKIGAVADTLEGLNDFILPTANDAWTMLAFYNLKIKELQGTLGKDKVYTILKSHVTTDGLQAVATYYQDRGYKVYTIDTYVGFTELAKKGRDLNDISRSAWDILSRIREGAPIDEALGLFEERNAELKRNVPYENAGLPVVEEVLARLRAGDTAEETQRLLDAVAHMENLMSVEESNGYGEQGYFVPEKDRVEGAHIAEKDGVLALQKYFEMLAWAKAEGKGAFDLFEDMMTEIGYCATDNQYLKYPGVQGIQEKEDAIASLEKVLASALQKELDQGKTPVLFGKYEVEKVTVYRDKKYDVSGNGFPEEGIRLQLKTRSGSTAYVTFRPSGTGDSNRVYSWIFGPRPAPDTDLEEYRNNIDRELAELRKDLFGIFNVTEGYVKNTGDDFFGLLNALKEATTERHLEMFERARAESLELTPEEIALIEASKAYAFASRKQEWDNLLKSEKGIAEAGELLNQLKSASRRNSDAWNEYITSAQANGFPKQFEIRVNGESYARIPAFLVKPLMISLSASLAENLIADGLAEADLQTPDPEVTNEIRFQLEKIRDTRRVEERLNTAKGELEGAVEREEADSSPDESVNIANTIRRIADLVARHNSPSGPRDADIRSLKTVTTAA